jgi:hypothetical protein
VTSGALAVIAAIVVARGATLFGAVTVPVLAGHLA